jgi:hypothetical protein
LEIDRVRGCGEEGIGGEAVEGSGRDEVEEGACGGVGEG